MSDENVVFLCLFRISLITNFNDFLKFNGQHSVQDELMVGKIFFVMF